MYIFMYVTVDINLIGTDVVFLVDKCVVIIVKNKKKRTEAKWYKGN